MRSPLQVIFDLFGARPLGRILASGLVGVVVVAWSLFGHGESDNGAWRGWLIAGASIGFLGGVLLTWPRAFPGAVIALAGLFVVCAPMSSVDGSPVPLRAYLIKEGIGFGILSVGVALLLWARRRRTYSPVLAALSDMRSRFYLRRVGGWAALGLALLVMGAGAWLTWDAGRGRKGRPGGVVMICFGGFVLYGAIRWICDQGHGLEWVPPDLEVPGVKESAKRAGETLSTFIELTKRGVEGAFIKFAIDAGEGVTEHIWGYVHAYSGDVFSVSPANEPLRQEMAQVDERKVLVSEVEDWMVVDEQGRIRGAYSLIALLDYFERNGKWLSPRMKRQRALLLDAPGR